MILNTGAYAKGDTARSRMPEKPWEHTTGSAFSMISQKPSVCRLSPRLFARPAVFSSCIFAGASFDLHAPSLATAKRQVPDSDRIYVILFYTPCVRLILYGISKHYRKHWETDRNSFWW